MQNKTAIAKLEFFVQAFNESTPFQAALADLIINANGVSFLSEGKVMNLPAIEVSSLSLKAGEAGESLYTTRTLFFDIHIHTIQPFIHRIIIKKGENTLEIFTTDIHLSRKVPNGNYLLLTIKKPKEQIQGQLVTFWFFLKAMPDMFLVIQNEIGPLPHYPIDQSNEEVFTFY